MENETERGVKVAADTKSVIADTFLQLLRRGSADKITVKQLIQECHISRQTFYYHFQDILDVMEWSIQTETERLLEQSLRAENLRAAMRLLIAFTREQYPVLRRLMDSQRRGRFERFMTDSMRTYLEGLMRSRCRDIAVSSADRETFLDYHSCAMVGILLSRCGSPDLDQERLAAQLEKILDSQLTQ